MMNKTDVLDYVPSSPDYEGEIKKKRLENYTMLRMFLDFDDIDTTEKMCAMREVVEKRYDLYPFQDDKAFLSWFKTYKKDMDEKITSYSHRWGDSEFSIRQSMKDNELFSRSFIKEPGKQSFHQGYGAAWLLSNVPFISELKVLNNGGSKALICEYGEIKPIKCKTDDHTKTIDFIIKYRFKDKVLVFYVSHKYTGISGGTQNLQSADVSFYLMHALQSTDANVVFLSITDGDYYHLKYDAGDTIFDSKLAYYKTRLNGERCISTTSADFIKDVAPVIIKWLKANFEAEEIAEELECFEILLSKF